MSARLTPGDEAPAFTLPDADGNEVSLADHKGRKVIVYFYPAALTPGCTKQACDFTDNLDVLAGAGYDEKKNYGKTYMGVIRSTIVVDEQGKVEHALYNVRATGHVAKIIKDLGI